jgi:hypothetical protein
MKRKFILTTLLFSTLFVFSFMLTAQAQPVTQLPEYATPTPGPDGRIIYIVGEGDTCLRIQLLTGVSIDQLRVLNRLDENCIIRPGQELVIGVGASVPATDATPDTAPTAIPEPTPTPLPGFATVCLLLYDDVNGDSLRQSSEAVIPGGAVSITGTSGQFSEVRDTTPGLEATCFENVPEGTYNLSAAAPDGYYPTTQQTYLLEVESGNEYYVDFGAQKGDIALDLPGGPAGDSDSSWLGIVGGILLLLGIGLGIYSWSVFGRKPPMQQPPRPPSIVR